MQRDGVVELDRAEQWPIRRSHHDAGLRPTSTVGIITGSTATGLVEVAEVVTRDTYQTVRHGTNCNAFQVLFNATAGREYEIITGAQYPSEGPFELAIALPPGIAFVHPTAGADFSPLTDIPLSVTVSDADGTIVAVEYSILFGQALARSTNAPWSGVWNSAPVGRHRLLARAVDNFGAGATSMIEITVGRPPNDDFAQRIALSGLPAVTIGNILAAGKEPGESATIGYYTSTRTVWWSWTAPSNGLYAILATATNPVVVGVYIGSEISSLSLATFTGGTHAAFIDGQYRYCSQAALQAIGGTTYQIVVDGGSTPSPYDVGLTITVPPHASLISPTNGSVFANASAILLSVDAYAVVGEIQEVEFLEIHTAPGFGWSVPLGMVTNAPWSMVSRNASTGSYPVMARVTDTLGAQTVSTNRIWVGVPRPVNDDFSQRLTISNTRTNITVLGSNDWASAEPGELYARQSVWWSWTAPTSGPTVINTCGSTFNADLRIYTGTVSAVSNLTFFGAASGGSCAALPFAAMAGTTYHIAVDGSGGRVTLNLLTPPLPPVRLVPSAGLTNGGFHIFFNGVPGQNSVLEASTDLVYWVSFATNAFTEGTMQFNDRGAANLPARFYRVRQE